MRASQLVSILVASIAVTFTAACNRSSGDAPAPSSSTSSASVAPASAAPATAASGGVDAGAVLAPSAKAARCPTLVAGSSATVADTADGVALTITAKDPAAVAEIRTRAHGIDDWVKQSAARRAAGGGGGGDGRQGQGGDGNGAGDGVGGGGGAGGGGGGGMGKCPVVTRYTTVDVKDSPTGAVVTMRPISDRDLTGLRRQVRERLAGD